MSAKAKGRLNMKATTQPTQTAVELPTITQDIVAKSAMELGRSTLWTVRSDGVYVWFAGQQIAFIPATQCKRLVADVVNKVDW